MKKFNARRPSRALGYGLGDGETVPITPRVSRLSTGAGDFALKVFSATRALVLTFGHGVGAAWIDLDRFRATI